MTFAGLAAWALLAAVFSAGFLAGRLRSRPPGTDAGTGDVVPSLPVPAAPPVEPLVVCPCGACAMPLRLLIELTGVIGVPQVATHLGCGELRLLPSSPEVRDHAQGARR